MLRTPDPKAGKKANKKNKKDSNITLINAISDSSDTESPVKKAKFAETESPPIKTKASEAKVKKNQESVSTVSEDEKMNAQETQRQNAAIKARKFTISKLERLNKKIEDDEALGLLNFEEVETRIKAYDKHWQNFLERDLEVVTTVIFESDADESARASETERMDNAYESLYPKLIKRLKQLQPVETATEAKSEKIHVELRSTEVTNTWGVFHGDYDKWESWRDNFRDGCDKNPRLETTHKLRLLIEACRGEAKSVLGDWPIVETNYEKAWEQLCRIYDDKYMQVQALMRKLFSVPSIKEPNTQILRKIIDTVQKCVHGLSQHIDVSGIDAFVVFLVIDKLDKETFRAWEKHRRTQLSANASLSASQMTIENANDSDASAVWQKDANKRIPSWKQLESFLEDEVSICRHAQVHQGETNSVKERLGKNLSEKSDVYRGRQRKMKYAQRPYAQLGAPPRDVPPKAKFFQDCVLCPGDKHPQNKCPTLRAMNFAGRLQFRKDNRLCKICLNPEHTRWECVYGVPNQPCPRCNNISQ